MPRLAAWLNALKKPCGMQLRKINGPRPIGLRNYASMARSNRRSEKSADVVCAKAAAGHASRRRQVGVIFAADFAANQEAR